MTNPLIWVAIVGWVLAGGVWAVKSLQQGRLWQAAYSQGIETEKASTGSAAVSSATATIVEERKAVEETPLTVERKALIEACKREASCRSRGKL